MAAKMISVVVSAYNEEQMLPEFYRVASEVLADCSWEYELLFVNDGSADRTREILTDLAEKDPHVKVVSFSRNFGHEAAMIAGIDYASGDGIVCMDADLQHPPQYIPQIIEEFEEGCLKYTHARPFTKESLLYRDIFEKFYPGQGEMIKDFWMPNKAWEGCDVNDPSARVLSNYGDSGK